MNTENIYDQQKFNTLEVTLSQAIEILNFINDEIMDARCNSGYEIFFFDIEIPKKLICGELAFARVDVSGDIYRISFHRYPPEIQKLAFH